MRDGIDLLQGTLELLILRALAGTPQHGFGIARWIRTTTGERLQIDDGALYPALHRMEHKRWIVAEWGTTENNRRARFYELTSAGRKQLLAQTTSWIDYVDAVQQIIVASATRGVRRV